jgi:hypothetical protein
MEGDGQSQEALNRRKPGSIMGTCVITVLNREYGTILHPGVRGTGVATAPGNGTAT